MNRIRRFNEANNNESSGISLKDYCKYLIDEYDKIKMGNGGRVMSDLKQFYEEGKIKDLITQNTTDKSKVNILNIYKDKISLFAKSQRIELDLMDYKEFTA